MRRGGISPGILISMVFLVVGALFAFLIIAAIKPQTSPPAASSPSHASPSPALSPPTIPVDTLANVPGTTSFFIDSLNDTSFATPPPVPIKIASGAAITLRGWAVDVPNTSSAGGVIVAVDTTNYPATYGVDRPDVATALGNPAYTKSGFSITFPANALPLGRHTITLKILTNDRTSYYQLDQRVEIEIV